MVQTPFGIWKWLAPQDRFACASTEDLFGRLSGLQFRDCSWLDYVIERYSWVEEGVARAATQTG